MSATKKKHSTETEPQEDLSPARRSDEIAPAPSLEDVSEETRADAPGSPARELQAKLENSINEKRSGKRVLDTGRVLASASGITALLGFFVFSGIW